VLNERLKIAGLTRVAQGQAFADHDIGNRSGRSRNPSDVTATRRLAAVLAADVAGYSRLMGADEEGTLNRLKAHRRQLVDPKISEHHGRMTSSEPSRATATPTGGPQPGGRSTTKPLTYKVPNPHWLNALRTGMAA
jgi:hypothetical protein